MGNYSDMQLGIEETTVYLERFFQNLLMSEHNELKSRYMIIGTSWKENTAPTSTQTSNDKNNLEIAESTQKSTQKTENSTQKSTQEKILDEIRIHPFTTRVLLAELIGISPDGIKKQLDKLKRKGIIQHLGPDKGGHWGIIEGKETTL